MKEIENPFADFTIPTYQQIPDVGLYLDQVVKYINSFFTDYPDMMITGSMLTNYVKQKVVPRFNRKTYVRDQIACFFFIALSKSVLSIEHIRKLIEESRTPSFQEYYDSFRDLLLNELQKQKSREEKTVTDYLVIAIAHKMFLEKYFSVLEETVS